MNWHYVSAGQPVGPVDETEFDRLVQAGTIQPETLVWNETMSNWQLLSQVKPASLGRSIGRFFAETWNGVIPLWVGYIIAISDTRIIKR